MSYYSWMIPTYAFPGTMSGSAVSGITTSAVSSAATTATTTSTAAATTTTTGSAVTASAQSAAAATAASSAFAAMALPLAVTILAGLTAGVMIDLSKTHRAAKRSETLEVPTFFSSKELLIRALSAYDGNGECALYENDKLGTVTARYRLEDYIFTMNPQTGCYDLTVKNAAYCEKVSAQIGALQEVYRGAMRDAMVAQLYEKARENGWVVESDEEDADATRTISLLV